MSGNNLQCLSDVSSGPPKVPAYESTLPAPHEASSGHAERSIEEKTAQSQPPENSSNPPKVTLTALPAERSIKEKTEETVQPQRSAAESSSCLPKATACESTPAPHTAHSIEETKTTAPSLQSQSPDTSSNPPKVTSTLTSPPANGVRAEPAMEPSSGPDTKKTAPPIPTVVPCDVSPGVDAPPKLEQLPVRVSAAQHTPLPSHPQLPPPPHLHQNDRDDVPITDQDAPPRAWVLPSIPRAPRIPVMYDMTYGSMRSPMAIAAVYTLFAHIAVEFALLETETLGIVIFVSILLFIVPAVCTTQPFGSPFATVTAMAGVGIVVALHAWHYLELLSTQHRLHTGGLWAWRLTVISIVSSFCLIVFWILFLAAVQLLRLSRRLMGGSVSGSNFVMQALPWLEKSDAARRFRYTQWRLSSHRDRRINHDGTMDTEHENTPPPDANPVQPMARMIAACVIGVVFALIILLVLQKTSLLILDKIREVLGDMECPCDLPKAVRDKIDADFQTVLVTVTHQLAAQFPSASFLVSALPLFESFSIVTFLNVVYIATMTVTTALEYGSFLGVVAAGALVVSSWVMLHQATLENQRKILRQGPPAAWRVRKVNVTDAEPFIGQMALAGIVQAVQGFFFGLLLVAVVRALGTTYKVEPDAIVFLIQLASTSIGAMIVRSIMFYLIVRPFLTNGAKMKHPRMYLVVSAILGVLGLLAGIVSFVIRYVVTFVVVVWNLGRPDIVAFPSLFGRLDGIHTSYMSALIVDNEHNNPHLQSLCTALIADMHTARRARASHNELIQKTDEDEAAATAVVVVGTNEVSPVHEHDDDDDMQRLHSRDDVPSFSAVAIEPPQFTSVLIEPERVPNKSSAFIEMEMVQENEEPGTCHLWQKEVDSFSDPTWSAVPAVRVLVEMHLRMRSGNPADPTHALQLPVAIAPVSPAQDMRRRRRAFVAARWRLASLLAANPSLRPLRKLALREAAMRAPPVLSLKDKALLFLPRGVSTPTPQSTDVALTQGGPSYTPGFRSNDEREYSPPSLDTTGRFSDTHRKAVRSDRF